MARDIKVYTSTLRIIWEKLPARKPEVVCKCHFCDRDILDNEERQQIGKIVTEDAAVAFNWPSGNPYFACRQCCTIAGLEW